TGTHSSWLPRRLRSTRRSTTTLVSLFSATASVIRVPFVMLVNPSFSAKTVPEFIAYAKANPGMINFASGGTGFAAHLAGELFKVMPGVNRVHVPYRGHAPEMPDLAGKRLELLRDVLPRLRRLAIMANAANPASQLEIREVRTMSSALGRPRRRLALRSHRRCLLADEVIV